MNELIKADYEDIVAIADVVRNKTGTTDEMSYDEMVSGINGIKTSPDLQDKTVTPTATIQTITADEGYDGLNSVIVNTDVNLIPENIASGISIFGVEGNVKVGGSIEDALVARTATEYTNDRVTTIGDYAFYSCKSLTAANFPNVTTIGSYAFYSCTSLTTVSFPKVTSLKDNIFRSCWSLKSINLPLVTSISHWMFNHCTALTTASFPKVTTIGSNVFSHCTNLKTLYLMGSTRCTLANSSVFNYTPIKSGTGSIYVPTSLLASYQTATNWTYFSNRFVGV